MVREKSGSAFRNVLSKNERKRTKTITGCSRFIDGQNVISTNIMRKKRTGEKTYFSWMQDKAFLSLTTFIQ